MGRKGRGRGKGKSVKLLDEVKHVIGESVDDIPADLRDSEPVEEEEVDLDVKENVLLVYEKLDLLLYMLKS